MSIADAVTFFSEEALHRSYPVVDDRGQLLGLVARTDALRWKQEGGLRMVGHLADVLSDASILVAHPETPCGAVADMMVESGTGRVPIVDPQTKKVVGILSRQDLLKVRSTQKRGEKLRPGAVQKVRRASKLSS
jgi:CBS domain-containing protein